MSSRGRGPEAASVTKKLFIRTFGCQMNEYDSDKMADLLRATKGFEITDQPENADLILFNACSVRERAQEKVFHDLGRVKHLKQARRDLLIGVGGCVASQEGAAIVARAPYVDLVFGPQTLHRLPELIDARQSSGRPQVDVSFPEIEKFDKLPPACVKGPSAFVSIMEGCSKYCSFCVVPYTRGEEVSRPFEDVVAEIDSLGVKEVTLLGQNVNAWRGTIDGQAADFTELLFLIHEIDELERIRYTTSHPREFTQRLIDAHRDLPKLAPHVHLPVQSGSDRVLAAMKRGYTSLEYRSIARRLRQARPDISLTSDFIVGFPGESEADFAATLKLARELQGGREIGLAFAGEADDEVGGQADVGARLPQPARDGAVFERGVAALHRGEHPVGARLHRQVHVRRELRQVAVRIDEALGEFARMRSGIADSLQLVDFMNEKEQFGEIGGLAVDGPPPCIHVLSEQRHLFHPEGIDLGHDVFKRTRDFLAARVRHHAEAAVFAAAFHDRHECGSARHPGRRQMIELLDFRERDVDLRLAARAAPREQLRQPVQG